MSTKRFRPDGLYSISLTLLVKKVFKLFGELTVPGKIFFDSSKEVPAVVYRIKGDKVKIENDPNGPWLDIATELGTLEHLGVRGEHTIGGNLVEVGLHLIKPDVEAGDFADHPRHPKG